MKRIMLAAVIATAALSITAFGQMSNPTRKAPMKFKVRIENISNADGFTASNGMRWPFAISPGAYSIHRGSGNPLFKVGSYAGHTGLEAQAEDGNPEMLIRVASHHAGVLTNGTFNTPAGTSMPGPVTPGAAFEFEVMASPGAHLFITFMFGQSNDLFFGNENGIDLFDKDGKPLSGDVTSQFGLWDAGTEVNEEPGIGPNQAPRQKSANTGTSERKKVGPVKDGFTYPATTDVLRITINPSM
ncbi:MAG TPA: spondin domain-containing protein [Pyrinomonadaceae bacterium]